MNLKGSPMYFDDLFEWNAKVRLLERVHDYLDSSSGPACTPVSFYEGLAHHLASGFLTSLDEEVREYGYVTQRAA